ncbi:hypothetical protein SAMN05444377_10710 [Flavobacterium fontis]|uniref:Uncharacterized protein n=1 Tax=Flavobacterium fontis TaxID=1124188 RepID=A0A1M5AVD1_9FLAO|nr:hypothetical protein [Flavobacterium fontis]SHF34218.1 hypothetical protein SAMN05444377_10710 [Flavobacterium fontis]
MINKKICLDKFIVLKNDFTDLNLTLENQFKNSLLYEDMFLAKYIFEDVYIDIGWISHDNSFENGFFKIIVFKDDFYNKPIFILKTKNYVGLIKGMKKAIKLIEFNFL